jgi:putative redox protein
MVSVKTTWESGMAFDSVVGGHHITIDSSEEFGGKNRGPTPKPLLLTSLSGCTAMDVVSLLHKMRVEFDGFSIAVEAEASSEHPKVYTRIHLIYELTGSNIPSDKVKKAVDLSQERYCGVSAMLRKASELTYEIRINGDRI